VIDVSGLGASGYDAADWLREHRRIDMGLSDHRRIEATMSLADDDRPPLGCWQRSPPRPRPIRAARRSKSRSAERPRPGVRAGDVAPRRVLRPKEAVSARQR